MAKTWDQFYPTFIFRVKACPTPTVDMALREAAISFCSSSLIWEGTQSVSVVAPTSSYDLTPPAGSDITQVLSVFDDKGPLYPTRDIDLDQITGWITNTDTQPRFFYLSTPTTLVLYPTPTADYTLTVRAAYSPTDAATGVEDFIYENWRDVIVYGALEILFNIKNESWSDPAEAAMSGRMFGIGTARARHSRTRGHMFGAMRTAPRPAA